MTNEEKLIWIAQKSDSWRICLEAVKMIKDETVLADFAKNNKYFDIRLEATSRIKNEALLTDIVNNSDGNINLLSILAEIENNFINQYYKEQ